MSKYVECIRCHKKIYKGDKTIRRKGLIGNFCSYKCLVLENLLGSEVILTDDIVKSDVKSGSKYNWQTEV